MKTFNRREFIKYSSAAGATGLLSKRAIAMSDSNQYNIDYLQKAVKFTRDGIDMTPQEYAQLLTQLAKQDKIKTDN